MQVLAVVKDAIHLFVLLQIRSCFLVVSELFSFKATDERVPFSLSFAQAVHGHSEHIVRVVVVLM